jgi:hypothetical protein
MFSVENCLTKYWTSHLCFLNSKSQRLLILTLNNVVIPGYTSVLSDHLQLSKARIFANVYVDMWYIYGTIENFEYYVFVMARAIKFSFFIFVGWYYGNLMCETV